MADQFVTLNVGGVLYTTTRTTLTKYPDCMLANMFSGKHTTATDANGNYFIDRDGSLFRYVLNFLRSAQLNLPEGFKELDQLKNEADFYQLEPLMALLTNRGIAASNIDSIYVGVSTYQSKASLQQPRSSLPQHVMEHPMYEKLRSIGRLQSERDIVLDLLNLGAVAQPVEFKSEYERENTTIWRVDLRHANGDRQQFGESISVRRALNTW